MLFVLAAINLLFGIAALAGVTGLPTGDFGTGLAIFSFVVAALQAVAGVTVLLRKGAGRILGIVLAAIGFFLAAFAVLGGDPSQLLGLGLNGFVLYALTTNAAYFARSAPRP